jgi:hypothetical protein
MRAAILFTLLASFTDVFAADYANVARTADTVRVSGSVIVGDFFWSCRDKACKKTGPWYELDVEACRLLAQKVGRITYFGHSLRYLSAAQIRECNSAASTASTTVEVPPISAQIDKVVKAPNQKLPPAKFGDKPLLSTLGPQIRQFQVSEGCPYPGRSDSLGLSYNVIAAPDGAALATVEILQVLGNGTTRSVFVSPDDHRSVRASAPKVVDTAAAADVVRYMLRATDVRRRQSTKLLTSPYWAGRAAFNIGPGFTVERRGLKFVYMIPYAAENVAPEGRATASMVFRGAVSPVQAELIGNTSISMIFDDGYEGWSVPNGRFYPAVNGRISFFARQAIFPDGHLEMPGFHHSVVNGINDWSIGIRLPLANPSGCGSASSSLSATLRGGGRPAAATGADACAIHWLPLECSLYLSRRV